MNPHQEHTMQCPTCTDTALVMSDRQGVEIDYCPKCRGVWLDRGELDALAIAHHERDDGSSCRQRVSSITAAVRGL